MFDDIIIFETDSSGDIFATIFKLQSNLALEL